ncbi:hypothetical protein TREMEDRAFT_27733 [Tremella mesenterica DSM 1558]|uniref:uncharacterized protein n=1 Tax=Tremella mesenterica (strain ATCC 24925 / CBS 8224 / DSM 1558 / NBRC 9311 / NRRL Y-6157 / RJB 2259-6 / UBC 559-6) TaxID=578456 RepID=UPI0003F495F6|nr:uncharacterized protein TREMEDRAFT_27733 [Tremella mesenterica DSM 1558]EIW71155.1 hypothetical protein TREMEDRAFT_27733 [Tremella mesenterica DSM 1558]
MPPNNFRHSSSTSALGSSPRGPHPLSTNGVPSPSSGRRIGTVGANSASAIDLTRTNIRTPPPVPDKRPLCIGAIMSRALIFYPTPPIFTGNRAPQGSPEQWDVIDYLGAELIKVKLKYRKAGAAPRRDEVWTSVTRDAIQVMTPGMTSYLGDLDASLAATLIPHMAKGVLRLEGFAQRLPPGEHVYEMRLSVLLFTLPANVRYLIDALANHELYPLDPTPPYDPRRHSGNPPYRNGYGSGAEAMRMYLLAQSRRTQSSYGLSQGSQDRVSQVEVQRKQVDEVFKSLDNGAELEQSDPGPFIKTDLFPHQRIALTFLLQREQDWSALKRARKYADKALHKSKSKRASSVEVEDAGRKGNSNHSLWEPKVTEKSKHKVWRNKVTGDEIRTRRPKEGKGAILADDMGLGKTLSIVSLLAATRQSAQKWAKTEMDDIDPVTDEEDGEEGIKASAIGTKVFGMPDLDPEEELSSKPKKRKRNDEASRLLAARRGKIVKRAKATLLVCPMSTITNWEEQIKEHWNGKVEIYGGPTGLPPQQMKLDKWMAPKKGKESEEDELDEDWDTIRVYVYHGPGRTADPHFLAEFDIVITTYHTLAGEFSKQGGEDESTPGDTAQNSGDEEPAEIFGDTSLNPRAVFPEVEAEIKAVEVAQALQKKKKGKSAKSSKTSTPGDQRSPLQAIDWFRIVLDEAHYIKSPATVAFKASCALEADRRICLTGTPIQNKIEDVWALFKFLRLGPVDQKECFTKFISNPCKFGEQIGVARLQLVMRCCTLRRTKDSTMENGKRILNLPPRKEVQLWLDLAEDERAAYDERANRIKQKVTELRATNQLSKNFANVLQEVLRLRQICDHVDLARSGAVEEDYDGTVMDYTLAVQGIERYGLTQARAVSVVCFLKDGAGAQCLACGYDYGDYFPSLGLVGVEDPQTEKDRVKKMPHRPLLTKCLHLYCPKCFKANVYPDWSKRMREAPARECHQCRAALRLSTDVLEVSPPGSENTETTDQPKKVVRQKYVRPPGQKPDLSTKMRWLLQELMGHSKRNPNSPHYDPFALDSGDVEELDEEGKPFVTKSVVFSQWTTMLDRIGDMLDEANIRYARLDGTMTREERARATEQLRTNKKVEVLLVSTRAGGVGLNLTAASRCYLVDPYWNPSVESQAIDRIHRMGQTRPVVAVKLMINDSIEKRLDEIQKKKANLAQLSLKNMSRKELMEQKAEELASLFK